MVSPASTPKEYTRMLKLTNSLTRQKEDFKPLHADHVRIYACGPTVYDYAHIGNGRMAVVFDVLARVLKWHYPRVTYVSNITDVDDKIMLAAKEKGMEIAALTQKFERIYNDDMKTLGVQQPDIQPRATEHIPQMIALIERLIAQGFAYEAQGHALFHVPSFPAYGGLSGRSRDDQIAGARVEIAPFKKDPADFVLWKPSKDTEVGWNSPWGYGRPGWHIECSAMAEQHLGLPFDIHGGGADLKFPHHENEIAQSCCAHGHTHDLSAFAKLWVHNGFLTVEGEKMSKSLGNFTLVHDLLQQNIAGEAIRLALLAAHYRQPLDWSDTGLKQAQALLQKIYRCFDRLESVDDIPATEFPLPDLLDDLNTPKAFADFYHLMDDILSQTPSQDLKILKSRFLAASFILAGLDVTEGFKKRSQQKKELATWVEQKIEERMLAKQEKNYARADQIRAELEAQNILLEDTAQGVKWSFKS
jgi:cysteinyl-tRNA synthetase